MPKSKKAPEGEPATVDDLIKQQEADGQTLQAAGSVPETAAEAAGQSMFDAVLEMYSRARALIGDDPNDKMIKTNFGTVFKKPYTLTITAIHLLPEIVKQPEYETIRTTTWGETQSNPEFIELYKQATREALFAAAKSLGLDIIERRAETAESITIKRVDEIDYPLEKVSASIFSGTFWELVKEDTHGQLSFLIPGEKSGDAPINYIFSVDFDSIEDGLKITKKLLQFDKRVCIAVAALYNSGRRIITLRQIHNVMGNPGKPSPAQKEKIKHSILKMLAATIHVDNRQEVDAGYNYPLYDYNGPLLPCDMRTDTLDGQIVRDAIRIFAEPPIIEFARGRGQITTIPAKLLMGPVSKTEENIAIEDYLIQRISKARSGALSSRILIKTICEKANIKSERQQRRVNEKIEKLLEYYTSCDYIAGYEIKAGYVDILFADKKAISKKGGKQKKN